MTAAPPSAVHDPSPARWTSIGWNKTSTAILWSILAVGAVLRIARFIHWRALWLDEIYLAEGILRAGSYRQLLFTPLVDWQSAPPGFLAVVRLSHSVFGASERALRLPSLLAGLAALPLLAGILGRALNPRAAWFAAALFAVLGPLVYYSNELKQYSFDVAAALAVTLTLERLLESPTQRRAIVAAIIGGLAIFCSHPAAFVVAGAGLAALARSWRGRPRAMPWLAAVGLVCAACGAIQYAYFIRPLIFADPNQHLGMVKYWADRDAFLPRTYLYWACWLYNRFWRICSDPDAMWLSNPDAALAALITGIAVLARRGGILASLLAPLPFVLAASAAREYPFGDRLVLFLVPALIVVMAAGIEALASVHPGGPSARATLVAALTLGGMILVPSAVRTAGFLIHPPGREESLRAYQWIAPQWRTGDTLYLSYYAQTSFDFYEPRAGWPRNPRLDDAVHRAPQAEDDPRELADDVRALAGRGRVWVVLIHVNGANYEQSQATLAAFDAIGAPVPNAVFHDDGVNCRLYDCSLSPSNSPPTTAPATHSSPAP